jgi:glycine hydroxymethyltransferase
LFKPGDKILGFDLSWRTFNTWFTSKFSGRLYTLFFYGVDKETGRLDYDKIQRNSEQPKLIIAGASAYSRDMDFERFRVIADVVLFYY